MSADPHRLRPWLIFAALWTLSCVWTARLHGQAVGSDDAVIKWMRPAAEVTLAYDPPEPMYAEVWDAVATHCLHLAPDSIPSMAAWSFYRVDAGAFTTVWTGKALSVAYTHGPSHRIWFTEAKMAKPGSIAHEMLHAQLYDLGRPWGANHPSAGRNLPARDADSVFARCGLWPVPESYP